MWNADSNDLPEDAHPSRRRFVQSLGAAGAGLALIGCERATDSLSALINPDAGTDFRPPASEEIDLAAHALNRLTWGARPGDYQRVKAIGVEAFIDEQLRPESISDLRGRRAAAWLEEINVPRAELYNTKPEVLLDRLTRDKILRAVYSDRQLFEVMVDFWTDHFNIVSAKGDCKWMKIADDREVIRAHALGSFRELVRASALSPAMLIYLDGHDNKVTKPGEKPNENYARELLELHTLGVHGGYTQNDVMEVARCLSGWTYGHSFLQLRQSHVEFDPARHDDGDKIVLGHTIPAGGGAADLERVLDIVCGHASTARHIATKLCRRFIDDPPPGDAVQSVASAFRQSRGDIRETLRALFNTSAFQTTRGNLFKRPLRFVVSTLRMTDAGTLARRSVTGALERMGHAPFQYPTPDGYPIEAQPWLGTLLWRWNFAMDLADGRLADAAIDFNRLTARLGGVDGVAAHLLGRTPTEQEQAVLNGCSSPLALLLSSPAFQRH